MRNGVFNVYESEEFLSPQSNFYERNVGLFLRKCCRFSKKIVRFAFEFIASMFETYTKELGTYVSRVDSVKNDRPSLNC